MIILLPLIFVINHPGYSQANTDLGHQQKLLQSWQGFPDDNAGEIVIDIYNDNDSEHEKSEENIIVLPFFSDEEFTLRNEFCCFNFSPIKLLIFDKTKRNWL